MRRNGTSDINAHTRFGYLIFVVGETRIVSDAYCGHFSVQIVFSLLISLLSDHHATRLRRIVAHRDEDIADAHAARVVLEQHFDLGDRVLQVLHLALRGGERGDTKKRTLADKLRNERTSSTR
jgi:hypothetical protein